MVLRASVQTSVGQAVASVDWRERGCTTRCVPAGSSRASSSSSGAFLQRASRLYGARAESLTVLASKTNGVGSESPFDDEAMSGWSALLGRRSEGAEAAAEPAPPESDIDIVELLFPTRSRMQLMEIPSEHLRVLAANPTRVASQLAKLKSMLPVADATAILLQRPHAILELDMDVRHPQAVKLRAAFAPVVIDTLYESQPKLLDTLDALATVERPELTERVAAITASLGDDAVAAAAAAAANLPLLACGAEGWPRSLEYLVEATRRDNARTLRRGSRSLAPSVRGRQRGGRTHIADRLVQGLGFVRRKSRIPSSRLDEYIP